MLSSKVLQLTILSFIGLTLTSCLKPRQQDEVQQNIMRHHQTQTNASFYIGRVVSGTSYDHDAIAGWSLPETKYYNFRACLSDRITNDRIIGHRFEIVETQQVVTTDDEGCLSWDDYLPFNYFAERAHYLTIEREIKGIGIHSGSHRVELAVNPWKASRGGNTPEIVDLERQSLPIEQRLDSERTSQFIRTQFDRKLPVEVKDLSVTISSRQITATGNEVDIHVVMSPQVVFTNLFGERVVHKLNRGEFDVYFQITANSARAEKSDLFMISEPMMASTSNLKQDERSVLRFQDDKIDIRFQTEIRNRITHGHYELTMRLVPKNISSLGEFFGVYQFSESHSLLTSRSNLRPRISSLDDPQERAEYETKLDRSLLENLSNGDFQNLEPFQFDHLRIAFMRVLPDETTTKRSIAYRSEVCVRRSIDGRLVQFEDFVVKKADGTSVPVNTEAEGCFAWIDTITHKYYQPENIIKKSTTIEHARSAFTKELSAFINPWDYGWTFGQDARKLTQEYIDDVNNREAVSSQLLIAGYSYQTIRFRYEIDRFLNLNVKKTLLLDISPKVLRYNSITRGRNATESLRDGVYLMKVAIQKDYYDPRTPGLTLKTHETIPGRIEIESAHNKEVEFINAVEKLVRVKHGRIITPVEFSINDLRLMRVRSNFLIEMSAIDEAALGITPQTSLTSLNLEALASDAENLNQDLREHPRRYETPQTQIGQYVLQQQYFSDAPFEITDAAVQSIGLEDRSIQRNRLNLDQFIDRDSGLPTRTFVGPIILLSNAFGAGLRPTDDLEEISDCDGLIGQERVDCLARTDEKNTLDFDNNPLVAKFYGSSKHLENLSVTDLMERSLKIEQEFENQQTYESLMSRYVEEYYLDYVSLTAKPLKVLPQTKELRKDMLVEGEIPSFTELAEFTCGSEKIEDCLVEEQPQTPTTKEVLLAKLNFERQEGEQKLMHHQRMPVFTEQNLREFIQTGTGDQYLAERLCHTFTNYMMSERNGYNISEANRNRSFFSFAPSPLVTFQMAQLACVREARRNLESVFAIDRKLQPRMVEGYRFRGGKSMNFNVGSNFSLGFDEGLSSSLDFSFDPLSLLKNVGGAISSIFGVFSVKTGSRASVSRSVRMGTSVSSGTYLAMQKATMELYFDQYEPCIEVRMTKNFLSQSTMSKVLGVLPEEIRGRSASQGLFICSGEIVTERKAFPEWYYYFTQHFTEGDMLDNGDLLNHPWLLAMRGERNYAHFINLIKATPQSDRKSRDFDLRWLPNEALQHYLDNAELVNTIPDDVNLGERPLDQLIEAYNQMPPTFPGLYTVRPKRLEYPQ